MITNNILFWFGDKYFIAVFVIPIYNFHYIAYIIEAKLVEER